MLEAKVKRILLQTPIYFLAGVTMAVADSSDGYGGGYYGHPMMWGDDPGFFGFGMMLVFWAIIIGLVVFAVRWTTDRGETKRKTPALDILKERLAKGEIEPEEYEARSKVLES